MVESRVARTRAAHRQSSRAVAAKLLRKLSQGRSLSTLFDEMADGRAAAEISLIKELCFGVARWWPQLESFAAQLLKQPLRPKDADIHMLILLGLYQLQHMRVAPHAALAETVEASRQLGKPWASGLVNAVLRRFQRERELLVGCDNQTETVRYACPEWLLQRLQQAWPAHWEYLAMHSLERPPMSLRVNLARIGRPAYLERLVQAGIEAQPIAWVDSGLALRTPLGVEMLPGFSEGLVSVQDGGAQLAAPLLDPHEGDQVLDACAAPGGKSGHLLEWKPGIRLTAIDIDVQRNRRVAENLRRLGFQAEICQGDSAHPSGGWAQRQYDRILLDVPCSATGVMRRHPDIKLLRQHSDIAALSTTQRQILHAIWPLLKPGGILLYATCSLLPEENHLQVADFLESRGDARELTIDAEWGHACSVGRQTLPGEETMDGFYYASLQKC